MSYVDEVIEKVITKNPGEPEFHQAVKEVLESLRPVVEAHEEQYRKEAILERLVEANMKKDKEILEEVLVHLRTMRDTWKEVMKLAHSK